jgi:hypothetical protein
MSQIDQQLSEERLAALERVVRFSGYARLYGSMAVLALALSFMPLFDDVVVGDVRSTYGSLWDMAGRNSDAPAGLGIILLLALVALLSVATFGTRNPTLLVAIAVDAALIVLMLLTKPGTGEPTPSLSGAGQAGLVTALGAMVLTITHAVHLKGYERRI